MTDQQSNQASKIDQVHGELDKAIKAAMERNMGHTLNADVASGVYINLSQQARQILTNHIEE